jgi:hypothetical protein
VRAKSACAAKVRDLTRCPKGKGRVEEAVESLHHFVRDLFKAANVRSHREDQDEEGGRFVTADALQLLTTDAETLIAILAGKTDKDAHGAPSSTEREQ